MNNRKRLSGFFDFRKNEKKKNRSVSEWFKTDDLSEELKFKKPPLENRKKNK